ncbi:MAG TPA: EscU/YscU/HrcU family type III secretion system export apparatus switch protein [Methylocella sp.]|nr:EscU/YscU/HrcU family type III secretion system export apparatus switch protein [Methylocella sp.]
MPGQEDSESKTEEPTEKKIHDEFEKGNVPISREASLFASTAATLIIAVFLEGSLQKSISFTLQQLASDPAGWPLQNLADAVALFSAIAWEIGCPLLTIAAILIAAGFAAGSLQHAPRLVFERIKPDPRRLSLINGWRRIFSARGQAEFLKSVIKLFSVTFVLCAVLRSQSTALTGAMLLDPAALPDLIHSMAVRLLIAVCVVTVMLLAADLLWVRAHWRKDIRMTRQELKDEIKDADGNPLRKARLRSLALDRRRNSMIAAVPRATLVIANPTHFAIALRYVREEGGAPMVLAKGKDFIALKIKELAGQHAIPVIEDKPLAQSMYDAVVVDQPIPPEFYKAVAALIHLLYVKNSRKEAAR